MLASLACWYIDTIKTAPQCISLRPHSRLAAAERLQACQTQERLIFPRLQSSPPCCCHKQGNDLAFIHSLHTIAILLSGAPLTHCTCDRHTIGASSRIYLRHEVPANSHDKLVLAAVGPHIRQLVEPPIPFQRCSLQIVEIDPLHITHTGPPS